LYLWGHGMPCSHIDCIDSCHLLPFHAILCHPMPSHALPYHAAATMHHTPTMPHNTTMLPCHDSPHALPLPSHATAAICCYLLPPMPSHALPSNFCPQIQETHTMVGAQWWRHNRGHNMGAQCGHTVGIQW